MAREASRSSPGADVPESPAVGDREAIDRQILASVRRVVRALDLHSRGLLRNHGITTPQLLCLTVLDERGPLSLGAIAHALQLSPATVTGIVDRLEKKGFLERTRMKDDRRVVHVSVRPEGREFLSVAPRSMQARVLEGLGSLRVGEKRTILESLERLIDFMEASDMDAAPILAAGAVSAPDPPGPGAEPDHRHKI